MSCSVRLIGCPEILDETGQVRPVRGFQPWAVLTRVLLADRPLTRRELSSELFPDTVDPMGALRWCLAGLRRAVGSAESFAGDPVRIGLPEGSEVDVWELIERGTIDLARTGELLEGVNPKCGPAFETWLLVQREWVAGLVDERLRAAVIEALSEGKPQRAVTIAELAARRALFDEGAQILLVKSLAAAGCHEAAAAHVTEIEGRMRDELGVEPSTALRSASRRHVAAPPSGASRRAVAASLLEAGNSAIAAGATDAGLDCLRRACLEAESCGDDHLHARCLLELGSGLVHAVRSHDDEGSLLLRRCADLADHVGDRGLAATALREIGYIDALAGRRRSAVLHLDRALAAAGDDLDLLAGVRSVIAFNLADWGRSRDGVEEHDHALELARRAGNRRRQAWILGLGGWAHLQAGDAETARRWLSESVEIVTELRWVAFGPWPRGVLAEIDLDAGTAPDAVRSRLDETFALSCQLADPCWEGATARVIARSCERAGNYDEALDWVTQARVRCRRETDTWIAMHAAILATDAELSVAADQGARAERAARELVALAARANMDGYLDRGLEVLTCVTASD